MPETRKPTSDAILAHVRMLRATDRLLQVAHELERARDNLQTLLEHPPATTANKTEGRADD